LSEIGIVLSDFGTPPHVFNNLLGLFFEKNTSDPPTELRERNYGLPGVLGWVANGAKPIEGNLLLTASPSDVLPSLTYINFLLICRWVSPAWATPVPPKLVLLFAITLTYAASSVIGVEPPHPPSFLGHPLPRGPARGEGCSSTEGRESSSVTLAPRRRSCERIPFGIDRLSFDDAF
jgi:hypothetical protein